MEAILQSVANCSGLSHYPGLSFRTKSRKDAKINKCNAFPISSGRILRVGIQCVPVHQFSATSAASVGRGHNHLNFDDDLSQEPFLLTLVKDAVWSLKSLFVFLLEQPGQLKYIEWPGFRSTLKTATLTLVLVLVALLIVALSSTDSALSYLLALILRRKP